MGESEIILIIVVSALISFITTKIVTTYYFDAIDDYVKGVLEDTKEVLKKLIGQ